MLSHPLKFGGSESATRRKRVDERGRLLFPIASSLKYFVQCFVRCHREFRPSTVILRTVILCKVILCAGANGNTASCHQILGFGDGVLPKVKNACCQNGVGTCDFDGVDEMLRMACTATGDDWNSHSSGDGGSDGQVVPIFGSIAIHASDDNFTGT